MCEPETTAEEPAELFRYAGLVEDGRELGEAPLPEPRRLLAEERKRTGRVPEVGEQRGKELSIAAKELDLRLEQRADPRPEIGPRCRFRLVQALVLLLHPLVVGPYERLLRREVVVRRPERE